MPAARKSGATSTGDATGAEDQHPRSGDRLGFAVLPSSLPLPAEGAAQIFGEHQDQPEDVLGDRPLEHAARVGDDDVTFDHRIDEHRLDPDAPGVDPPHRAVGRPRRAEKVTAVVPDEHHVGAAQRLGHGCRIVHEVHVGQRRDQLEAVGGRFAFGQEDCHRRVSHRNIIPAGRYCGHVQGRPRGHVT